MPDAVLNDSLTTEEAGKVLGVSGEFFEDLASDYPWLKPFYMGKGGRRVKRWPRDGVLAMKYIMQNSAQPEDPVKSKSGTADGG